jgi:hypothetical protein
MSRTISTACVMRTLPRLLPARRVKSRSHTSPVPSLWTKSDLGRRPMSARAVAQRARIVDGPDPVDQSGPAISVRRRGSPTGGCGRKVLRTESAGGAGSGVLRVAIWRAGGSTGGPGGSVASTHTAESVTEVNGRAVFGTPKTHVRRSVPIPRSIADELAVHVAGKDPDDYLFPPQTVVCYG